MKPTDRLILDLLADWGEAYGLDLVKGSGGLLKRGSVYVRLGRLRESGLVKSRLVKGTRGQDRTIFSLTPAGKDVAIPKCPTCGRDMNGPVCRWECDLKHYDCNVCRNFAGNGGGQPSDVEPWHCDCYVHQHRWNKPRCTKTHALEVHPVPAVSIRMKRKDARCELEQGHDGPCRFVYMEPEEIHEPEGWGER